MVFQAAVRIVRLHDGLPPLPTEDPEEWPAVGEDPRSCPAAPEKLNLWAFSPVYSTILTVRAIMESWRDWGTHGGNGDFYRSEWLWCRNRMKILFGMWDC